MLFHGSNRKVTNIGGGIKEWVAADQKLLDQLLSVAVIEHLKVTYRREILFWLKVPEGGGWWIGFIMVGETWQQDAGTVRGTESRELTCQL